MNLKYEVTPENMAKFAADIVESAREISNVTLDYSVESLASVDQILGEFHEDGLTADQIGAAVFGFGAYVGEVFVRNRNAAWKDIAETDLAQVLGPIVVEIGGEEGRLVNPIGKCFKRLANGDEDNLPYFYSVFSKEE